MLEKVADLAGYLFSQLPENALTLVAVSATFLGFWAIGRTVGNRHGGEAALLGWALVYLVTLLASVVGAGNLRWIAWLFLIAALVCLYLRRRELVPDRAQLGLLLPLLPMIVLALLMPLLHWDSYWHWVLNGSYLYRFDTLPQSPLDGFPSFHPTYPAGSVLVYYFASQIAGQFLQPVGMFTNVAVSLIAMDCVARVLRETAASAPANALLSSDFFRWYGAPLLAFLIVLPLNPSFQAVNFFSAIVDPMLSVIVLVMLLRWWSCMAPAGDASRWRGDLFVLFMLGVLISGVKPSGWVLTFVLSVAGALTGILRRVPLQRWLLPALAALTGSLLSHTVWQIYLKYFLDVGDQFSIQPIAEWRFDLIPLLWQGIVDDLLLRFIYYGMVLLTIIAGLLALRRPKIAGDERLALLLSFVAIAMPLHLGSLLAAYLGTGFYEIEIARAASLHRYSTHVGFAVCVMLWLVVFTRASRTTSPITRKRALGLTLGVYAIVVSIVIALPALLMGAFFKKNMEGLRETAMRIATTLPVGETVVVLGGEWSVNFATYTAWNPTAAQGTAAIVDRKIIEFDRDMEPAKELLSESMADGSIDHVWLFNAQRLTEQLSLPDAENLFWSRSTGEWRVLE